MNVDLPLNFLTGSAVPNIYYRKTYYRGDTKRTDTNLLCQSFLAPTYIRSI